MTNPSDQANGLAALAQRLQDIEVLYMHLQRTVGDLDQVIVAQGKKLDELEKQIGGATELIRTLSAPAGPPPTLLDEKPPHY